MRVCAQNSTSSRTSSTQDWGRELFGAVCHFSPSSNLTVSMIPLPVGVVQTGWAVTGRCRMRGLTLNLTRS